MIKEIETKSTADRKYLGMPEEPPAPMKYRGAWVHAWVLVKCGEPKIASGIDMDVMRVTAQRDYEREDNDNPLNRAIRFDVRPEVRLAAVPLPAAFKGQ